MIIKETFQAQDGSTYDWVDVENGSVDEVTRVTSDFGVHSLIIQAVLEGGERPRIQDFDDYSFIVLQPVLSTTGEQSFGELYVVLSKKWILSFHRDHLRETEELKKAMAQGSKAASQGPDFLFYSILSRAVDSYFTVSDNYEARIDMLEDSISQLSSKPELSHTISLRRDVVGMRRVLSYTREVVATMLREDFYDLSDENERYFRDAHFQLSHLLETAETYREFLADLRDSYMSQVSLALNQVMKKLTMVGTVALPLLVVSGIYGMNLQGLPGSDSPVGGIFAIVLMIAFSVTLGFYFRAKNWV